MSGRDPDEPRLPPAAEELLTNFPAPERPEREWEELAYRTLARVGKESQTEDALLAAPLPRQGHEPVDFEPRAPSEAPRSGKQAATAAADDDELQGESLAAIARAAVAAQKNDRQNELVKAGLSHALRARRSARIAPAAVPPSSRADTDVPPDEPEPSGAADGAAADEALGSPDEPSERGAPRAARSVAPAPADPEDRRSRDRVVIWALSGALAAAAAALIYVSNRPAQETAVAQRGSAEPTAAAAAGPEETPGLAEGEPKPQAEPEVSSTEPLLELDELPEDEAEESPAAGTGSSAPLTLQRRTAKAAAPAPAASGAASSESEGLDKAIKERTASAPQRAGSDDEQLRPAARKRDLPDKPALGAVQAAIGASMTSARQCLAGHDGPAKATVTFGSDGKVDSVSVSGPAAGSPAEGCIRAAFMKARVPAFAEPSFSASITVRPP